MIFNIFNKFNFICFINDSSYNLNFLLQNKFTKSLWVGKISKKVKPVNEQFEIYDLDQRALMAYDLAKLLNIPMPKIKYIDLQNILNSKFLLSNIGNSNDYHDYNKIIISRFSGQPISILEDNQIKKINRSDLLKIFIFDCWIGNFDKKDSDYIVDSNKKIWTIDYQLWGPVDNSKKALGFCAENKYEFKKENANKYCIAPKLKHYLDFTNKTREVLLKRIENLSNDKIRKCVNKYNFYYKDSNEKKINKEFEEYLCLRRDKIRENLKNINF